MKEEDMVSLVILLCGLFIGALCFTFVGSVIVNALILLHIISDPYLGFWGYALVGFAVSIITGGTSIGFSRRK